MRYYIFGSVHSVIVLAIVTALHFAVPKVIFAEENCVQLLTQRCEVCHYLTRVCFKVENEMSRKFFFGAPESTWNRIITNMIRQGAQLSQKEKIILVECLSKPTKGVMGLCNIKK